MAKKINKKQNLKTENKLNTFIKSKKNIIQKGLCSILIGSAFIGGIVGTNFYCNPTLSRLKQNENYIQEMEYRGAKKHTVNAIKKLQYKPSEEFDIFFGVNWKRDAINPKPIQSIESIEKAQASLNAEDMSQLARSSSSKHYIQRYNSLKRMGPNEVIINLELEIAKSLIPNTPEMKIQTGKAPQDYINLSTLMPANKILELADNSLDTLIVEHKEKAPHSEINKYNSIKYSGYAGTTLLTGLLGYGLIKKKKE